MNKVLNTGWIEVWSNKSTGSSAFIPATGPINTNLVDEVRPSIELAGMTDDVAVAPAYRMSNDGVEWSSTVTELSSTTEAEGWTYDEGTADVVETDQKLFVQFGFKVTNVNSSTQVEMAKARLRLEFTPTKGQTLVGGPRKVWSDGSNPSGGQQIFHALTKAIPYQDVDGGELRVSMEMNGDSGQAQLQAAFQVSNDGITWDSGATSAAAGTFKEFGSQLSSNGFEYPSSYTAWSSIVPTVKKQWVRFGVAVDNETDTGLSECCQASIRVDVRAS